MGFVEQVARLALVPAGIAVTVAFEVMDCLNDRDKALTKKTSQEFPGSRGKNVREKSLAQRASEGCPRSQYEFGRECECSGQIDDALELYSESAKRGYPPALNRLGIFLAAGKYLQKDERLAYRYIAEAANKFYADGQVSLGMLLGFGIGVEKDVSKAIEILKPHAADDEFFDGDAKAQYLLGILCGNDELGDHQESVRWHLKAAKQGILQSQKIIGFKLSSIEECAPYLTHEEASHWLEEAASQDDTESQSLLGSMYYYGLYGFKKDYSKAFNWAQKAAKSEDAMAQSMIGDMYYYGHGVGKDIVIAYYCHARAANNDSKYSDARCRLADEMTREQLFEATELVSKYNNTWKFEQELGAGG